LTAFFIVYIFSITNIFGLVVTKDRWLLGDGDFSDVEKDER